MRILLWVRFVWSMVVGLASVALYRGELTWTGVRAVLFFGSLVAFCENLLQLRTLWKRKNIHQSQKD